MGARLRELQLPGASRVAAAVLRPDDVRSRALQSHTCIQELSLLLLPGERELMLEAPLRPLPQLRSKRIRIPRNVEL